MDALQVTLYGYKGTLESSCAAFLTLKTFRGLFYPQKTFRLRVFGNSIATAFQS